MGEVFQLRGPQLILSLCDRTGNWSRPYEENGYEVVRLDLEHGQDVRLYELPKQPVHGILAAPPCTVFANSGARWPRTDAEMLEGLSIVDACLRIVVACRPLWWALENPAGKLSKYLGPPAYTFQPSHHGDPYTKFTCLWGSFVPPRRNPVEATEGSKMHRVAPGPNRQAIRKRDPDGLRAELLRGERMTRPDPSKRASRFVAQHRVERWSGDLREPSDLALGHPGSDRHVGEHPDGVALLRGLPAGGESGAAVLSEFGAELRERIVGHSCIVLDNRSDAKYFTPMTDAELLSYTNSSDQADAVMRVAIKAETDLGADTRAVAYSWDPGRGYVTLESGGYINVVLMDGTITDEVPA